MQLWIVRHAVAVEREDWDGPDDDRPLTPKGERRFSTLIEALTPKLITPDRLIHSPLKRAAQTAELLRHGLKLPVTALVSEPQAGPGVTPQWIAETMQARQDDCIAIIGHEPDLSRCLAALIGGGEIELAKGAIACVEFPERPSVGGGILQWLIHPKLLPRKD